MCDSPCRAIFSLVGVTILLFLLISFSMLPHPPVGAEFSPSESSVAKTIGSIISSAARELLPLCKRKGSQGRLPSVSRSGGETNQKERTCYHKLILLLFGLNIRTFCARYTRNIAEHRKCAIEIRQM